MSGLPPVRVPHPHVVIADDGSPYVYVGNSKAWVRRLFSWHRQGTTVESLLRRYPTLGPARIFDALAFAYDNLDLITADLAREREAIAAADRINNTPPAEGADEGRE